MEKFVKFPRTHWLPIGEKLYKSERYLNKKETENLFSKEVHVSEKLDGANVGISFQNKKLILQKRGGFIGKHEHPQYGTFKEWAYSRYDRFSQLSENMVLFGEWMFAKHSIHYTKLPDYFFLLDIWEREKFLEIEERDKTAKKLGLCAPPVVYKGVLNLEKIPSLIQKSHYSDELMEGVVVRNAEIRGKYIRKGFIRGDKHWSKYKFEKNLLVNF